MNPSRPHLLVLDGPRRAEAELVARVGDLLAREADATVLAAPIRVIVASESQRLGVSHALARRHGALAGVVVQTHHAAAFETLRRAAIAAPAADALLPLLVRRAARRQPVLRALLDDLAGGYGVAASAVRDLLEAGFEASTHGEPLLELLAAEGSAAATAAEVERVRALVVATAGVEAGFTALGVTSRPARLRAARAALDADPHAALPTRALLVHGFADGPGIVLDWLEALLRAFAGVLLLARPPVPGDPTRREEAHTRRLARRFAVFDVELAVDSSRGEPSPAALELWTAPDPDAEALAIARRLRELLDAGVPPEGVLVTARDPARHVLPLRRRFGELGIPFSGLATVGPPGPAERDLGLLAELLERRAEHPVEPWLDLLHRGPGDVPLTARGRADLRLGLLGRGVARLGDAAAAGGDERREDVAWARGAATGLAAHLARFGAGGPRSFQAWRRDLAEVVDRHLGWPSAHPDRELLRGAIAELGRQVPGELAIDGEEATALFATAIRRARRPPLGGEGGGVQVLSVVEAQGRTAEHLFVLGTSRGIFPRPLRPHPLLDDRLRAVLLRLLPDLPIQAAGFDEERYLFAQLLAAAPRVVVSRTLADSTGRPLGASPLLDRLPAAVETRLQPRADLPPEAATPPPTVVAGLAAAGLHGRRGDVAALLPVAARTVRSELAGAAGRVTAGALAAARLAILGELDPDRETRGPLATLGPYFGFVGPARGEDDPRHRELWVTTLENLAACPWQTFLRRGLRLRPTPDPLGALPSLAGRLVGSVVHRVLERVLATRDAAWPSPDRLDGWLAAAAEEALAATGGASTATLAGLARAAGELARPFLEVAREVDWMPAAPQGASGEVTDALELASGGADAAERRLLRFQADRRDRLATTGIERWTDYKTAAPPRRRPLSGDDLLALVAGGEWLQAAAYAQPRRADDAVKRQGRYLFLHPDLEPEARVAALASDDPAVRAAFHGSVSRLLALWDAGAFFPRLAEPDDDLEPPRCRSCEVAAACLRRDSGARLRLRRWAAADAATAGPPEDRHAERAALAVWTMRRTVAAGDPAEGAQGAANGGDDVG